MEQNKLTPCEILVLPIDKDLVLAHINAIAMHAGLLPANTHIQVSSLEALLPNIDNVIVNFECCYSCYNNKCLYIGKDGKPAIDFLHAFQVMYCTKITENGESKGHSVTFGFEYLMPFSDLIKFCKPPISLLDFMGTRYNYNPRIKTNTREFLEAVSTSYIEAQEEARIKAETTQ